MLLYEVTAKFEEGVIGEFVKNYEIKGYGYEKNELSIARDICNNYTIDSYNNSKKSALPIINRVLVNNNSINLIVYLFLQNEVIPSVKEIRRTVMKISNTILFKANLNPINYIMYDTNSKLSNIEVDLPDEIENIIKKMVRGNMRYDFHSSIIGDSVLESIKNIDLLDDFTTELKRIEGNKYKTFHGHPVNYLIRYEDRYAIVDNLVSKLYENNRILSLTVTYIDDLGRIDLKQIGFLYERAIGGTLIFEISNIEKTDDDMISRRSASITQSMVNKILEFSSMYSSSVLTIIALSNLSDKELILDYAKDHNTTFLPLLPKTVSNKDGMKYLQKSAKTDGFRAYTGELLDSVYTPSDLDKIYSKWRSNHLITSMGYSNISTDVKKTPSYDPMGRLNNMIGLTNVKETVNQILSYFKMQKVYLEKGITASNPCRHMVFYGNPGTAKTTIARLLGIILKQEGVLNTGKFVETGRNGLVAKYVGHTALKTMEQIKKAKGGILFIDEAYSLNDGREGSFGEEAINTLVQEMDNVRDDTIIIFAGYPDKMEKFMDTNPGIRSRIGFHVKFDNYSKDELMEILLHTAKKEKFTFTEEALDSARKQIEAAIGTKDFGNGRFIRTLVEQAMMKQATRISQDNVYLDMTNKELTTIQSEDISTMNKSVNKKKVGFNL